MKLNPKGVFTLLKDAAKGWSEDKAPRLGAALAYYTIFSISPLLIIVIAVAGFWLDRSVAQSHILGQISSMLGENGAKAIESMLASAQKNSTGVFATIIAVVTLFLGATGVFIQLQDALNSIWKVKQKPGGGIMNFVTHRLLSFAMILGIAFLLLVSLILSAGLTAAGKFMAGLLPGWVVLGEVLNFTISLGVVTVLIAMIFKFMPDVIVRWRDVWTGALLTAALFTVGKSLLGLYLGRSSVTSAYGAAGSLVVVLLWVYYSAQILFFGCEVTRLHAVQAKSKVKPKPHAEWISTAEAVGEPVKGTVVPHPSQAPDRPGGSPPGWAVHGTGVRPKVKALPAFILLLLMFVPVPRGRRSQVS